MMKQSANLVCVNPKCRKIFPIKSSQLKCDKCDFLLDVEYKDTPSTKLKETFLQRRNSALIYDESGVWRFRELLNFVEIETEEIDQCSKFLVSLDGAEGRQSKPYHMSKVSNFINIDNDNLMLQPEGYNPSGSFKDNGMSTAVTHAKMMNAKKPSDYVLATGEHHSVKDFVNYSSKLLGFNLVWKGKKNNEYAVDQNSNKIIVKKNKEFFRPTDVFSLKGNSSKAKRELGWYPRTKFKELVKIMVEADRKRSLIGKISM